MRGKVASLGADCEEKQMDAEDARVLEGLLSRAGHHRHGRRTSSAFMGLLAGSIISISTTRKNIDVDETSKPKPALPPRVSATFDQHTIAEIHRAAATGIYRIRGAGTKRKLPHFDDLLFLGASISRYPLEGYRERCGTDVTLGTRFAKKPITLKIPVTIAGMSFGALSAPAKEALGRGATLRAPPPPPATAA